MVNLCIFSPFMKPFKPYSESIASAENDRLTVSDTLSESLYGSICRNTQTHYVSVLAFCFAITVHIVYIL